MIRFVAILLLLCTSARGDVTLRHASDVPTEDCTRQLIKAIAKDDVIRVAPGEYHFWGPLPLDQDAASEVAIEGPNRTWVWQHWEENKVKPKAVFYLHGLGPGEYWWTQTKGRTTRGPVSIKGVAFQVVDSGGVFSFGDFADPNPKGADARGNSLRLCSFHGRPFVGDYFVRGVRQYNFEIDRCSFRGQSGIELSGDMPTLSKLRMGMHCIGIRTFNVSGHDHVPGTISDVEMEGVSGTGICCEGDNLLRSSVEVGYGFTPADQAVAAGRVIRFAAGYALVDSVDASGQPNWLSSADKCPPEFVKGEKPPLVQQVPAVIAGNRCCVTDCRFEVNRGGIDTPQFVAVPYRSPIRINGVPELYGLGRETTNRPVVSAWCEGAQHCLFGQILTDHLQLCEDAHPLVNSRQPFDPNWGAHSTAANGESQALRFRRRDGRWVYRLSDAAKGWTRRTGGVANVWSDGDRALTLWDGRRKVEYKLAGGWTRLELPAGNLRGEGLEVEL